MTILTAVPLKSQRSRGLSQILRCLKLTFTPAGTTPTLQPHSKFNPNPARIQTQQATKPISETSFATPPQTPRRFPPSTPTNSLLFPFSRPFFTGDASE